MSIKERSSSSMRSHSQNNYPFREPIEQQVSDVYIAIMGVTGAGKSTFISQLADSHVPVGNGLNACTQDVAVYRCKSSGPANIWLVDTPGFDDTHRSDTDVLREIANWLMESFSSKKVILNGIIYLHRITDIRMQGSAMKNLFMFKKLCGPDALKNVILATTMWERVGMEDGERREQELERTSEFWGEMIMRGALLKRHQNNANSAWSLVDVFASKSSTKRKAVLTIQQEMVVQHKPLAKTDAGMELESSLVQEREKWSRELERTRDDMREALAAKDKESLEQLRETEAKMNKKIDEIERAREELKIDMRLQYESQITKLHKALEKQTLDTEHNKKKLQDLEKTLDEMQAEPTEEPRLTTAPPPYWESSDTSSDDSISDPIPRIIERPPHVIRPPHIIQGESYKGPRTGEYNLSITGIRYFFCGPRYQVWRMGKEYISDHTSFPTMLRSHTTTHVCFGSNRSWYHHCYGTKGHNYFSSNFKHEYSRLFRRLKERIGADRPTAVALGGRGHYFFSTDDYKWWNLPNEIEAAVAPTSIKQLWLGRNDTFVLVNESGTIYFDLKGHYTSLSKILREMKARGQSIKALALDLEYDRYFIMYGGRKRAAHVTDLHPYEKFLTENRWI